MQFGVVVPAKITFSISSKGVPYTHFFVFSIFAREKTILNALLHKDFPFAPCLADLLS